MKPGMVIAMSPRHIGRRDCVTMAFGLAAVGACRHAGPGTEPPGEGRFGTVDRHRAQLATLDLRSWGRLRYVDHGRGPVALLVHGVPTSSWLYRRVIEGLAARGMRVIAPDLLGWGASDKPRNTRLLTPMWQAARLIELMDALNIPRWHQLCHDAGGPWTYEMLAMLGESVRRVESLTLLNTILDDEHWHPPLAMRPDGLLSRIVQRSLTSELSGATWTRMLMRAGLADPDRIDAPHVLDGYHRPMPEGAATATVHFMANIPRIRRALPRFHRILRDYPGAVAALWGGEDRILRVEQLERLRALRSIPDERIRILESVKHFVPEEAPDEVVRMLRLNAGLT